MSSLDSAGYYNQMHRPKPPPKTQRKKIQKEELVRTDDAEKDSSDSSVDSQDRFARYRRLYMGTSNSKAKKGAGAVVKDHPADDSDSSEGHL